jgi:hypothetical protein
MKSFLRNCIEAVRLVTYALPVTRYGAYRAAKLYHLAYLVIFPVAILVLALVRESDLFIPLKQSSEPLAIFIVLIMFAVFPWVFTILKIDEFVKGDRLVPFWLDDLFVIYNEWSNSAVQTGVVGVLWAAIGGSWIAALPMMLIPIITLVLRYPTTKRWGRWVERFDKIVPGGTI